MKSIADFPELVAREHLALNNGVLFAFSSNQDFADSSREIPEASAGGLGLPDRDYYVTDDAKSREIRTKYVAHVQQMLQLLGDSATQATREAQAVMRIETALAKASLTMVEKRDPYHLFHKMGLTRLQALTPSFNWTRYLKAVALPAQSEYNVTEPGFFQRVQAQLASTPLADWKAYLRWHVVHARAPFLSTKFAQANFDFYGKTLRGTPQMPPRWKRCVQYVDRSLGEALGQVFVDRTFGADMKARTLTMTKGIEKAMESDIQQLPWMSEPTKQQALLKLHSIVNKVGYPDKWRDYSSIRIDRSDFAGNIERAATFEGRSRVGKDRQTGGSGRVGHDAPYGKCVLRSANERYQFPSGSVAAARVRPQDG